jgi:hypothetical protein
MKVRRRGQGLIEYAMLILILLGLFGGLVMIKDPIISLFGCVNSSLGCGNAVASSAPNPTPVPTQAPSNTYYSESSSGMTRQAASYIWDDTYYTSAHDGNTDVYGGGSASSVSFSLSGPGSLTIHQFGGGSATLNVDGNSIGTLEGGCISDNSQTFTISGPGPHTFLVNSISDNWRCSDGAGASWAFDGINWSTS